MIQRLLICLFLIWLFGSTDSIIRNNAKNHVHPYRIPESESMINKVSLTQKGYIQFLKYIDTVPPLIDYTFCIWMRSNNLTYSHPILSYSKHEEERLVRVWISPFGESINLEILGHLVFEVPVDIVENHWYHICQSWSSNQASWELYINGKLRSNGYQPELKGLIIEGEGDIVVGQEYTDFDKGLEDGIEGDIFGFNFILASTSHNPTPITNNLLRRDYHQPRKQREELIPREVRTTDNNNISDEKDYDDVRKASEIPDALNYFNTESVRDPKGLLDLFQNAFGFFSEEPTRVRVRYHPKRGFQNHPISRSSSQLGSYQVPAVKRPTSRLSTHKITKPGPSRILNEIDEGKRPLGLLLVELSFDCGLKKGAPLSGEKVLINWTKSPVRVFGGAMLKSVPPFCV